MRQNEAKYQALIDGTDTGLVIIDEEGRVIDANSKYVGLTGRRNLSEILGRRVLEWTADYSIRKNAEALKKCLKEGRIGNLEIDYVDPQGKVIPLEINAMVMKTDGVPQIFALHRDITERKHSREELASKAHELQERMKELQCVYAISRLVEKTEMPLEEILQGITDIIPSGWQYPEITCARIAFEGKEATSANFKETAWKQSADLIMRGEPVGAVEVCYLEKKPENFEGPFLKEERELVKAIAERIGDITERKRAEERLQESEKRFREVMYASADAILLIGKNRFVECNEATVRMLGYGTKEEFLQTPHPSELSPPTQPDGQNSFEKADEMMRLAFEGGFHRFEWMHRRANGKDFPVEVSLTPIVYEGESLLYCVWRDITERKKMEEEREKLIMELKEALAKVKTLSGLLPICASCKKIRNDKGQWEQMEVYIRDRSEAEFSHGICPECAKRLYGEGSEEK